MTAYINKIVILFALIVFASLTCSAQKPIKTKNNETIVFGRFILDNDTKLDHTKIELNFLHSPKGTAKVKITEDGFFCLKMKTGNSFVDFVQYKQGGTFRKILTDNCLTLSLSESDKAYYIGDIFMKWLPTDRDKIKQGFSIGIGMGNHGMGGAVAIPISQGYTPGEGCPEITIKEIPETIEQFHQIYPDDTREVIIQFMDLD